MVARPVLMGGATSAVGVVVLAVSAAVLARDVARSPDWGPEPLLGVAVGVLLVIVGVGTLRDRRRFPPGYRADDGPGLLFPYAPPQPGGADVPSYDCGDAGGAGGSGDCGGGGS
ncbi:hypothetical protein [Micromonospora sp. NPDC003776]